MVTRHCTTVRMDSLEEERHKEVRKLERNNMRLNLGCNLKVTLKITSSAGGKIHIHLDLVKKA